MTQKLYEEFIKLNPWPVDFDSSIEPKVSEYCAKNPVIVGLLKKIVSKLETFPPDPDFFKDPKPSLHDMRIWLTVTEGNVRFMLMVEYRLDPKKCFIVDFDAKS